MAIDGGFYEEYIRLYKDYTADSIYQNLVSNLPEYVDKREGSISWDINMPSAIGLSLLYAEIDLFFKNSFANTADIYWLEQRAKERGVFRYPATNSVVKGEFNLEIPIGSKFYYENLGFYATEKIDDFHYKLVCEEVGIVGNVYEGNLLPAQNIQNLTTAKIVGLIAPAKEQESAEDLRIRYDESLNPLHFGGNIADYKYKVRELNITGGVRVIPVPRGGGTVDLIIQDNLLRKPTPELIAEVQEKIDPIPFQQLGKGIAPIGHHVLVFGVEETTININFHLTFLPTFTFEMLKEKITNAIENYFVQLRKEWSKLEVDLIIRKSQIENVILDINGIQDIENTTLNGESKNLTIKGIPIVGVIKNV